MSWVSVVAPALGLFESHLVDAQHASLLQVCFGAQKVGVFRVIHWLLKVDVDTVCGPRGRHWFTEKKKKKTSKERCHLVCKGAEGATVQ